MSKKVIKARNFAFILYPESIPEDWQDCLTKLGIPMAVSPLHDLDETERKFHDMTEDEQAIVRAGGKIYKKAHYHVLYIAKNPVTVESIRIKIKRALGSTSVSHIEIVDNVEYYFQYLTHESSDAIKKNKHKYDKKDMIYINDFDIDRYITLDESQKNEILNLICGLIYQYKFENIFSFLDFYYENLEAYDFPPPNQLNSIIKANSGLLRLYFDGAYQSNQKLNVEENKL